MATLIIVIMKCLSLLLLFYRCMYVVLKEPLFRDENVECFHLEFFFLNSISFKENSMSRSDSGGRATELKFFRFI